MQLPSTILGKSIVQQLTTRASAPVLTIGADTFTRKQLARIDCFNFHAAARLSALLTQELQVKHTRDLYERIPPQALALPGLGAISLATLGAAFEVMKVGTLAGYITKHAKGTSPVLFTTMKHHVLDAASAKAEKKAVKAEKKAVKRRSGIPNLVTEA